MVSNTPPNDPETATQRRTPSVGSHISCAELVEAIETTLYRAGFNREAAALLANNHAGCERDGALSHGVFRIPQYVATLRTGYLDGSAVPQIERVSDSYLRIDAAGGIAQLALERAQDLVRAAVDEQGMAIVAIRNSHHHSALWPDLEPFAEAGQMAISMVTGGVPVVAPQGVRRPVLGTNPFAFATPTPDARPLIVDFATSAMSFGDLTLAAQSGRPVPAGTGVDADGHQTTDPTAIADGGTLLPFGGHKGAALSVMVELLASALTGGPFSFQAAADRPAGAHTTRTGQFLLVIDPNRGANNDAIAGVGDLISMLRAAGMERLPADHRYQRRAEAEIHGIPITPAIRDLLEGLPGPADRST